MIKVGIIGASGMAGSAIYKLAATQPGLDVTGIVRHEGKAKKVLGSDARLISGDIFSMTDSVLSRFDVIVDAFGTNPANAERHLKLAEKLINLARKDKIRLIFILGAGSLHTGDDQHLFIEDIEKLPNSGSWINTPRQQVKELRYLEAITDVDWVGISPAASFEPGPVSDYQLGKDELMFNDQGESKVTTGTLAEVVVSEIVAPKFHRERFTVVNTEK
ncbi:NAD(P)-dependent oxidoreductase [Limosilactobacillus fastidiosus]|uniref:NAD(P)H-binding protein n=1 Tax=Limosilactobacillus fastidiosus TaxID=2759855 RepID=A0A7W3TZP0_9LACO|nr:NAD(P)H-binding protein [Limosilactobacillus fastidiosus]MBB1062984.1 NAD(P)H-binding protein [Limosilactobacillus fastidiosus]MBB1086227.1 NAD(P)H-binding protein [Limosilactobacillus fastidiosus]MCD7084539.1 NAD(P)H-binding protein [Limosilactobacillus fastidiosus]MCD7086500.1 NAD(P)H-binding protein [Limosilactobacillus fastidiosus]MCD7114941.1 NAD(P)H-binding protein [Limosilactobacillus fastidiosus]